MTTINVKPLTRVEGHGELELILRRGRLHEVRAVISESPRLFEGLLVGRSLFEVPALICRICAICSSVHRIAACQALEKALGIHIPPAARRIRELLLLGGHMESHALHLFCLILPDLEERENILELLRAGNHRARQGLELKALANRIQELAGGRIIHPVNIEVGGVLHRPDRVKLESLSGELDAWEARLEELLAPFSEPARYPASAEAVGTRIAVHNASGFSLEGGELALTGGRSVAGGSYGDLLSEKAVTYSNAKHSRQNGTPLLAGALARLELAAANGQAPEGTGRLTGGIHANNAAQCIEMIWALRRCRELVEELLKRPEDEPLQTKAVAAPGIGTAVIEAPRGLLIHHYVIDDLGRIAGADIVTPTAINQAAIEEQVLQDLGNTRDRDVLACEAQRIVRSFDPCISCSVHLMDAVKS